MIKRYKADEFLFNDEVCRASDVTRLETELQQEREAFDRELKAQERIANDWALECKQEQSANADLQKRLGEADSLHAEQVSDWADKVEQWRQRATRAESKYDGLVGQLAEFQANKMEAIRRAEAAEAGADELARRVAELEKVKT
jgi:chromosome segregation ATPase